MHEAVFRCGITLDVPMNVDYPLEVDGSSHAITRSNKLQTFIEARRSASIPRVLDTLGSRYQNERAAGVAASIDRP
jgi:hypothetical protein